MENGLAEIYCEEIRMDFHDFETVSNLKQALCTDDSISKLKGDQGDKDEATKILRIVRLEPVSQFGTQKSLHSSFRPVLLSARHWRGGGNNLVLFNYSIVERHVTLIGTMRTAVTTSRPPSAAALFAESLTTKN